MSNERSLRQAALRLSTGITKPFSYGGTKFRLQKTGWGHDQRVIISTDDFQIPPFKYVFVTEMSEAGLLAAIAELMAKEVHES